MNSEYLFLSFFLSFCSYIAPKTRCLLGQVVESEMIYKTMFSMIVIMVLLPTRCGSAREKVVTLKKKVAHGYSRPATRFVVHIVCHCKGFQWM